MSTPLADPTTFLTAAEFDAIEAAIDARYEAGRHGPRVDMYSHVLTPDQNKRVVDYWMTLPGNYSWMGAYTAMKRLVQTPGA